MDRIELLGLLLFSLVTLAAGTSRYKPGGPRISGGQRSGPISGDCWQGALCEQRCLTSASKAGFVGLINETPVCCPFCERSGLAISSSSCNCRHNGPDPRYQPTAEELREVEELKNRLNSSTTIFANHNLVLAAILAVFSYVF